MDDARQLLKHADPKLGVPLPEKDYGSNCLIYDPDVPENPFHNFWVNLSFQMEFVFKLDCLLDCIQG